jgi:hypothetical protein
MKLTPSQIEIIDELYVRTADENYIAARWCSTQSLYTDFAWSAVHALEKYLKAVLLYNGRSVKGHGHDIGALYQLVKPLAPGLLPDTLRKPRRLSIAHWFDRTPEAFLQHLYQNGNADNRYLIFGHDTRTEDVHMLDSMVFAVRRLICGLDEPMFRSTGMPIKTPTLTYREALTNDPKYQPNQFMPLDDRIHSKHDDASREAALNLNFEFAPEDYRHKKVQAGDSSRVAVLWRCILEPLDSGHESQVQDAIETAGWLLDNVKLPKEVSQQIQKALQDAELKNSKKEISGKNVPEEIGNT